VEEVESVEHQVTQVDVLPSSLATVPKPVPVLLGTIPILDAELRKRCLDLYTHFSDTKQHERFDTVLADATKILEERLRKAVKEDAMTADRLAHVAFGNPSGKLLISSVPAEQEAVMFLFKGIAGHVRNPAHHRLLGALSPERTLQLIGLLDYAIHLIETAQPATPPITPP
jgi:hypothetical protein